MEAAASLLAAHAQASKWGIKPNCEQRGSEQSSQNTHHSAEAHGNRDHYYRKQNRRDNLVPAVPEQNGQQRCGEAAEHETYSRVHQPEPLKALRLHAADVQSSLL